MYTTDHIYVYYEMVKSRSYVRYISISSKSDFDSSDIKNNPNQSHNIDYIYKMFIADN